MALSNRVKFALVFIVVNLHVLRNLATVPYLAVYAAVAVSLLIDFVFTQRAGRLNSSTGLFAVWIVVAFFAFLISMALISPAGAVQGLGRFLFSTPIFLALSLYTRNYEELKQHIETFVGFFAFASLTIPLQFLTGPITWFVDASTRNGFERYSSVLGNLTAVGITIGSYVVLAQASRPRWRWVWLLLMVLPALISLNKSAIANVALGLIFLIILNRRRLGRLAIGATGLVGVLALMVALIPAIQERLLSPLVSFGIASPMDAGITQVDDVSATQSLLDRLIALPRANFEALQTVHSPFIYLTGGGFGMGNTALVPLADVLAPMAHNQFAESITVFGILGGSVQIAIMLRICVLLYRRVKTRSGGSGLVAGVLASYVILLFNSLFANGTLYQPASASVFFLALFTATASFFPDETSPTFEKFRPKWA